jgi:hypothetical protein
MKEDIQPKFFAKPSEFRQWLEKNHAKKMNSLLVFTKQAPVKKVLRGRNLWMKHYVLAG